MSRFQSILSTFRADVEREIRHAKEAGRPADELAEQLRGLADGTEQFMCDLEDVTYELEGGCDELDEDFDEDDDDDDSVLDGEDLDDDDEGD